MSSKKPDVSEREREIIEKVAKKTVDLGFEGATIMLLQTIKPLTRIGGELATFFLAPFLPLLDEYGYEFLDTFEKRENIELLIRRLELLHKESSKKGLDQLRETARNRETCFEQLMESVNCSSLGQVSEALYGVGGEYRRNM